MKIIIICCLLLASLNLPAQLPNAGFEQGRDTAAALPAAWHTNGGSILRLEGGAGRNGSVALAAEARDSVFATFLQRVKADGHAARWAVVSAWIRTERVQGGVSLWCQLRDSAGQIIGFRNLEQSGVMIRGTNGWKQYRFGILVPPETAFLVPGGFLRGKGKVWFDDFELDQERIPGRHSADAGQWIDTMYRLVKTHTIYRDSVDWQGLDRDVASLSKGAESQAEATAVGEYIIAQLRKAGDHHTLLVSARESSESREGTAATSNPEARMLEGNIAYIVVPGLRTGNETAMRNFANRIQGQIRSLDQSGAVKGWIVDLRENSGGNMYPMVAGLGPLIGEDTAGYFLSRTGREGWYYRKGGAGTAGAVLTQADTVYQLHSAHPKIAVLISPRTASSGEMTALSFVGLPGARLFGQASGGYTTGNEAFPLPDGSTLALASSHVADRRGKVYDGGIDPDAVTPPDESVLEDAIKWLRQ